MCNLILARCESNPGERQAYVILKKTLKMLKIFRTTALEILRYRPNEGGTKHKRTMLLTPGDTSRRMLVN